MDYCLMLVLTVLGLILGRYSSRLQLFRALRWFMSVFHAFGLLLFALSAQAQGAPPYPVIFVHGLNSSGATFQSMIGSLDPTGNLTGGRLKAWTTPSGPLSCSWTDSWATNLPSSSWTQVMGVNIPDKKRYFAIDFSDSNGLTLNEQGNELKQVIDCVKAITVQSKVILVAHSMGGLAARAYLQGYAITTTVKHPYAKDVAKLITIGTPHRGSPWPYICQYDDPSQGRICFILTGGGPTYSPAMTLLIPTSSQLSMLNDSINNLPDISYTSIVVSGTAVWPANLEDGDGIVTETSQNMALLPGLSPNILHKPISVYISPFSCADLPTVNALGLTIHTGSSWQETHTCEPMDSAVQGYIASEIMSTSLVTPLAIILPGAVTFPPNSTISSANATVNGTITPTGKSATTWFEYGPTSALGHATTAQNLAAGTNAVQISATLYGLASNTPYYYRVVAQNVAGTTYGLTLQFTTPPVATSILHAPSLVTPALYAWGQTTTPSFSWSPVFNAVSYRIMIATDPAALPTDPSSATCTGCFTDTSNTPNYVPPAGVLSNGTVYWWQIKGRGATEYGYWSPPSVFATALATTAPLPAPTLTAPTNGVTTASSTPVMSWTPVSGADSYWIMVANNPANLPTIPGSLTCPLCSINDVAYLNSYTPSSGQLISGVTYYWQVMARNTTTSGTWSSPASIFITGGVPAQNNATCGAAAGSTFTSMPTGSLCSTGWPSAEITGVGPWFWSCFDANGHTQNCLANIQSYTVSTSATGNGMITPSSQTINLGSFATFTVAPSIGSKASVSGCGISQSWIASPAIVTTGSITGECTVSVTFSPNPTTKYSKICNNGQEAGQDACPADPELGSGATKWACTRDNTNGLLWEVKTNDHGLRDQNNTYTWYDTNPANNDGDPGTKNGGVCVGSRCDTSGFADAVSATGLCGANDWRMPTHDELVTLVDAASANNGMPAIDGSYFPNTLGAPYWSGTPFAGASSTGVFGSTNAAWEMNFFYEYADGTYPRGWDNYVQLVSGGNIGGSFDLAVSITGSGSVTSNLGGINCGSTCTGCSLPGGSSVTLSETPEPGASFIGWGGACTGTSTTCTVLMSQYRDVTATFTSLVVNGSCGSANDSSYPTQPTSNLCSTGATGTVGGSGPWNWSCSGSHGGTTASCSANLLPDSAIMTNLTISGPATVNEGTTANYSLVANYSDGSSRSISLGPPAGTIITVAGNGTLVDYYIQSYGIALDDSGDLYFADLDAQRILKVSSASILSTVAGTGTGGFSGDDGPAIAAQFHNPHGIAFDASGNLYVADTLNHRIRKISADGTISTIVGTGVYGFDNGDGVPASSAQVYYPAGVAVDGSGNLYIADYCNIRKVAVDGTISTVAGPVAVNGQITGPTSGYSGDNGPATSALLSSPQGIAVDGSDNLFIADRNNHRIRKISVSGIITTVAGTGECGHGGDNGQATSAQLCYPMDVAMDSRGDLLIADNTTIRKVMPDGIIKTVAGGGSKYANKGGDNCPATDVRIGPVRMAVDTNDDMFIADNANVLIRKVVASGGGSLNLAGTSDVSLSGGTLTAVDVTADQTVTLSASYSESGVTKTASLPVTIKNSAAPVVSLGTVSPFSAEVGLTSAAQGISLSNTGGALLNIASIVANGDFAQTNNCGTILAAGTSCSINVTFTPTVAGPSNGDLTITSNAAGSPQMVSLIGTGMVATAPKVSLSTTELSFAAQPIGTTSATQTVTVTNTGNAPLTISGVVTSGDFVAAGDCDTSTSGTTLAVGESCNLSVNFSPSAEGACAGEVTIISNGMGGSSSISLSGISSAAQTTTTTTTTAPTTTTGPPSTTATTSITTSMTTTTLPPTTTTTTTAPTTTTTTATPSTTTGPSTTTTTLSPTTTSTATTSTTTTTIPTGQPNSTLRIYTIDGEAKEYYSIADTVKLKANFRDAEGFDIDATSLANWTSSNTLIAEVGNGFSKGGSVTFKGNGEVRIFSFLNGLMHYMDFKVGAAEMAKHYGNLIILAGGKSDDPKDTLKGAIQYLCNRIYQVFKIRMFKDEDIYYINNKTDQDFNGDDTADGIVDQKVKSVANLHQAMQWAADQANDGPLYLYLMDHGYKSGTFQLDSGQILTATQLDAMLDEFEEATHRTSVVILEACYSGSFVNKVTDSDRMIVTSSSQDQYSFFSSDGVVSFGQFFMNRLLTGETWDVAFDNAVLDITKIGAPYAAMSPQKSIGEGVTMSKVYGDFTMGSLFPEIKNYTKGASVAADLPQELSVQLAVTDAAEGAVWVMVTPPNYQPPTVSEEYTTPTLNLDKVTFNSSLDGTPNYSGSYTFPCGGQYTVTYYAKDSNGMVVASPPQTFTVTGDACDFTTQIAPAWNLISLPVTPADPAVGQVLAQVKGTLASAWKWENGTWAVYLPGETDDGASYAGGKGFGQLSTLNPGEGFWVNSSAGAQLTIPGTPATGELTVATGWNLVGLKSGQAITVAELVAAHPGIISLWKWENGTWAVALPDEISPGAYAESKGFGVLGTINPGEGFWVHMP